MKLNETWRHNSYSEWPARCQNCRFYRRDLGPQAYCTYWGLEGRFFPVDPQGHCRFFSMPPRRQKGHHGQ